MADLMKRLSEEPGTGRMAFLAHKEDIRKAVAAGYKAKAIWRAMRDEGIMPVGYETFLRYVRELPEYGTGTKGPGRAAGKLDGADRPKREPAGQAGFNLRNRPETIQELMETNQ